ncbi:MAG: CinA family protein [Pirellulaceae bacterium]
MSEPQSLAYREELAKSATALADDLAATGLRLVLAESCTGGLAAATLAAIPGISRWFCGSAVTYRDQTKIDWLDVAVSDLARVSAISREVAGQMAVGVLQLTSEADVAVSITGHLGPQAPANADGMIWVGVARRGRDELQEPRIGPPVRHLLSQTARVARQHEAAALVLRHAARAIRTVA